MSGDNEYRWVRNAIFVGVTIIGSTFIFFYENKRMDDPMYYLEYHLDYVGIWQNTNKNMSDDTLSLERCDTFCKVTFQDNGEVYTENKGYWSYRTIRTDVWYRTAVKNRTHSFIEKNGISQSDIRETLTLSDDGKTLTSVVSYYDKVNKKSVQLGEQYTYHKIE